MRKIIPLLAVFFCLSLSAQNYNMSTTSVTTCTGTFYDSGGAAGNYGNGQNFTMTFCPATAGSAIRLDFSAFNLASGDNLYIYDGANISAPMFGQFSGTDSPGIVQATGTNTGGCITVRFVSDTNTTSTGWVAAISCITPCQVINAVLDSSTPAADPDGIIRICQGESVTFNGSGTFSNSGTGATYEWTFDDGTTGTGQSATVTYPNPGVYRVNLRITDPLNCVNNNLLNQVVQVSTTPTFTTPSSADEICLGQSVAITGNVTPTPWLYQCTPPVSGTTFLPDGSGASYTTSIVVDCFDASQTLTNMNQLQSICLNMEHSYLGDLQIKIISPNGQQIILKAYPGGGSTYLGSPLDDPAVGPGTGSQYCFSMTGTQLLVAGPTAPMGNPVSASVVAGTYLPAASFAGLVGSPLNGTWTIQVTDNLGVDNGYIFSWGMTFDPALVPGDLSFTPTIAASGWNPDPTITNTSGNTITVTPGASGNYCYTYWATDNFGCTYQTQKCITVLEAPDLAPADDLTSCTIFNLEDNIPVILNGLDPIYYPILFHTSQADAENVCCEILSSATYTGFDGEIIYYSVQDNFTTAGCIYTGSFQLNVNGCPGPTTPPDLAICDDPSNDGIGTFDFTPQTAIALGTFDPADYAISYHLTLAEAEAGTNDISPIDSFTNTTNCQTIYVRMENISNPAEYGTTDFDICVLAVPAEPAPSDVVACDSYTLPALPAGQTYHNSTGGGSLITDNTLEDTQVVYIFSESGTTPNCTSEGSFIVTINDTPAAPTVADVSACDTYTLPALPSGQSYHTASGGASPIPSLTLNATQVVWVFAETGTTPNCTSEASFTVTINDTPPTPVVSDVTACDTYTLPALAAGQTYHTATGGSSSTEITDLTLVDTQVVYVFSQTGTTPNCSSEASFTVTINDTPAAPTVADVSACDTYTLPALPAGQSYHTASGGASPIPSLTLNATQVVWVFAETGTTPNCTSEASFTVTINDTPPTPVVSDVTACDTYTLPALPAGQTYHTATGGASSTEITDLTLVDTQVVYVFSQTGTTPNCSSEANFTVTINDTPAAPTVADVSACDTYTLPALPSGQSYHTASGGASPIPSLTLNATQVVWIFAESGTTPNCTSESSFTVTINDTPPTPVVSDVTACDTYTLPALPAGQSYHTATGGASSTEITDLTLVDTQVVYVFSQTGTTPNCSSEASFTVTINDTPAAPTVADVSACDTYTLPALAAGQSYHTASGGASPIPSLTLNATQVVWVFAETGTTPNCTSEASFTVTINDTPPTPVVSDVTACDTYTLPALPAGQTYHTATGGASSTEITDLTLEDTQVVYVFSQTGTTPNCSSEASFTVTINDTPAAPTVADVSACDTYTLPALAAGQSYHTASGGASPIPSLTLNATQVVWIFAESGTTPNCTSESSFTVTINDTPPTPVVSDVTACDSYTLPALPAGQSYHTATGGASPVPSLTLVDTQVVYVFSQTGTTPNCSSEASFTVTINDTPQADDPADVVACDTYTLPALGVGNYFTASGGLGIAHFEGDFISASTVLYVYAESGTSPNCFTENSFAIDIYYTPVVTEPTALQLCDDNNDGIQCFDLTPAAIQATGGDPDLVATFYETPEDAQGGAVANQVPFNYCNIDAGLQTLYVRVAHVDAPQCAAFTTLLLQVNPRPMPNPVIEPYALCDYDTANPGVEGFDLPSMDAEILNMQTGIDVTYYLTQADAQGQTGAIDTTTLYYNISNPQQMWFTVSNPATGCFSVGSFSLIVNPLPMAVQPEPMNACSDGITDTAEFILTENNVIASGGVPGMVVTYYPTLADAQSGNTAAQLPSPYTSGDATVYIRVENGSTGCFSTTSVGLVVSQGPVANQPDPLQECDDNNDGFAQFDLTQAYNDIHGGPAPAGVTVTFYETQEDAETGYVENQISTNYTNIDMGTQTIYVRVSFDFTGCANFTTLQLIVNPVPEANTDADPLQLCDDNTDGVASFNLTLANADILDGMDPAQYSITYHVTQAAAQAGTPWISGVLNYSSATATIWVRVEDNTTGCFDVVPLELIVNPLPVVPVPVGAYTLCDVNNPGDQIEEFDLFSQLDNILLGQSGLLVTFHESDLEAQQGINDLPQFYTNSTSSPAQTLHIRVEDAVTGCFVVTTMDIRVEPLPMLVEPLASDPLLTACDDDSDCFASFDLDALIPAMLQGATGITVTFYETLGNAENGAAVNALSSPYTNIVPCNQTIYVRAQYDGSPNCYSVISIELNVNPAPMMPILEDISKCDTGTNNQDGITNFDLTTQEADILAAQLAGDYEIQYFESQADAQAGFPFIIEPWDYDNEVPFSQQIWVRIENNDTGCYKVATFTITVDTPLVLATPAPLSICDDGPTSALPQAVFDLTVKDLEITGGNTAYTVEYFVTQADQQSGNNPITPATAYTNIANAQTLYVAVTGPDPSNCRSFTTLTIRVLPLPVPLTDAPEIEVCDDNAPSGTETFDLTVNEDYIANGDGNMIFEYYESQSDAEAQINMINPPTAYQGSTGTIYIRVMRDVQADFQGDFCYVIITQAIRVNPLPQLSSDPYVFTACETDGDGFEEFTLSSINDDILAAPQNPDDFAISYHLTLAQAQTGSNPLPDNYTNTTPWQQNIYVHVINNVTKCETTGVVTLEVLAGATAFPVDAATFATCDDDTDGIYTFDLTLADAQVLGTGQSNTLYSVDYFATLQDIADEDPIDDYTAYESASGTIYAVVNNLTTGCTSDPIPVAITVEALADPVIATDNGNTICVDFVSGQLIRGLNLSTNIDPAGYTFEWFLDGNPVPVGTNPMYFATVEGVYSVLVTSNSALGCVSAAATFTVIKSGPAVAQSPAYTVTNPFGETQITVNVDGFGAYEYSLDGGPWQSGNVFEDVGPGTHYVDVRDSNLSACGPDIHIGDINAINYPHFFTPNGDGINDTWNIIGLEGDATAKIYIFDRYGKLLKQISPMAGSPGWDGTFTGQQMPSSDYWFTVFYNDNGTNKEFKAHFSLKR